MRLSGDEMFWMFDLNSNRDETAACPGVSVDARSRSPLLEFSPHCASLPSLYLAGRKKRHLPDRAVVTDGGV